MTHVHEDMGAYVLGALDATEAKRVEAHLAECEECAKAHAELAGIPGLLDLAVVTGATEDEPLPPAIEERLLDRFARERTKPERKRRWRPRLALGSSALAGAAVAVAALVFGLNFERNGGRPDVDYGVVLEPIGAAQNASARAGLRSTPVGTRVLMWVYNLPGKPGDVYEVLCDAPGWTASAGTFTVDAQGNAYVVLTTAMKVGNYDGIRIVRKERLGDGKFETHELLGARLS
ncbi:MAG TPA: zf-HC2 domain-containing protein [Solirubrobacter sp.]|nr:zf-HC2 domain-containing protein [Solirubrobacter sp.]